MAVVLPEGDLQARLSGYLDGLKNRHGLEESSIEGNVVIAWVKPGDVPAVVATARPELGVLHLWVITVVGRGGSLELTDALLDLRGGRGRGKPVVEAQDPV